jgi:glycosyltransferase involved in cell wall biosynthesis
MASGLPVIAADAAAVPEVVRDAMLCQPGCVDAFADAILRLRDDSELRLRLARVGARRVRRYDIMPVTRQFLQEINLC